MSKLKYIVRRFIVKRSYLVKLTNYLFRLKNEKKFKNLLAQKRSSSLFDINVLSRQMPYPGFEYAFVNNMYGTGRTLRNFFSSGIEKQSYIEHGACFGDYLDLDQSCWNVKQFVTSSKYRQNLLSKKINKNTIAIGPYIHYAKPFLSLQYFEKYKSDLEKTLLVFPGHSTKNLEFSYNQEEFIKMINKIATKFDCQTVLVCLFWVDCHDSKIVSKYNKAGFRITCAGHRFDIDFLDRLKTIILLSDITLSNSVGTHVGYCVHLNKPHFITGDGILKSKNKIGEEALKDEMSPKRLKQIKEVSKAFFFQDDSTEIISPHQRMVVNKYWGSDLVNKNKIKRSKN